MCEPFFCSINWTEFKSKMSVCTITHADCVNNPSDNWSRRQRLTWLTALMCRWISNSCLTPDLLNCKPSCHGSQVWCFWQGRWVQRCSSHTRIHTKTFIYSRMSVNFACGSYKNDFVGEWTISNSFHMNTNSRQSTRWPLSADTNIICKEALRSISYR